MNSEHGQPEQTETPERQLTKEEFLEMLPEYRQWAERDTLEMVFHVFADNADSWTEDEHEAFGLYQELVKDERPARLYVELYSDRENDVMEHEDCLLSYEDYPW